MDNQDHAPAQQDRARHLPDLNRFLERMLGGQGAAADIAAEAYKQMESIRMTVSTGIRALLFDIATNLAIDYLRSKRVGQQSRAPMPSEVVAESLADRHRLLAEEAQQLQHIVREMDSRLRDVFILRYVTRAPIEAIALQLRTSTADVERQLQQARSHCRRRLYQPKSTST